MIRTHKEPFGLISLSSDFGVQSQGVGAMEAMVYSIAPDVRVIHLMHGLPEFDIVAAARTLETLDTWPRGYHVCVCDPGVGTERRALALQVARGDYLVGPDNGVLIPAAERLGGITQAVAIENPRYMAPDVSPLFHGRDVFAPAAAHLACGVMISDLGPAIPFHQLRPAPYTEASVHGREVSAMVIQINKFGSLHLNIRHSQWDTFGFALGDTVCAKFGEQSVPLNYKRTFGEVAKGECLILKDDYGRVEIAINMGRFADKVNAKIGSEVILMLP